MLKISGLENVMREVDEAKKALEEIGGELGSVNFDPHDPASVEAAIVSMEGMIDDKLGRYGNNNIIAPMIQELKKNYRDGIIDKASQARLTNNTQP